MINGSNEVKKIILVTNIPNAYRLPLFNQLDSMLREHGMQLLVVFAAEGYARRLSKVDLNECKFQYKILGSEPVVYNNDIEKTSFSYQGLVSLLRSEKPYRIIVSGFSRATLKIYLASFFNKFKYIIWSGSVKAKGRHDGLLRTIFRKVLLSKSSSCVAYGTLARNYLISLGARADRVLIGINTVDTRFFREETANERQKLNHRQHCITFTGYLVRRKQVMQFLHCIKELKTIRNDFTVDILGDGECKTELMDFVSANGLSNHVFFHGFIQKSELPKFLAKTSVFAFQTGFDIWGLTLNEAMAAGLPCLATKNAGSTFDLVKDGVNGFVVDFSETKAVAMRINELLNDPELADRIGKSASDYIIQHASLAESAKGFIEAIRASE